MSANFAAILYLAAGILFILALRVGNASETYNVRQTYPLVASFDNIGGLKRRAPVKSAGVVVGRVTGIGFDNQTFEAVVTMSIDSRYQFPLDTGAKILTSGLLGEQYIGLAAGGDDKNLKGGDTLKITQSAVVLENLISQFLYSKAAEGDTGKKNNKAP